MITYKTKNVFLNTLLVFLMFSFSLTSSSAQEIWQVDSSIEDLTVEKSGRYYILNVRIKSHNDDDARSPKLIVNLPRNCRVNGITMPAGFENTAYQIFGNKSQAVPSNAQAKQIDAYINFDLDNLGTTTDISFKISFSPTFGTLRPQSAASAFIYTLTPEATKSNNFATVNIN